MSTAIERLGLYNGNDYQVTANPLGFGKGGHRINFIQALYDVASVSSDNTAYAQDTANNAGITVSARDAAIQAGDEAISAKSVAQSARDQALASQVSALNSAQSAATSQEDAADSRDAALLSATTATNQATAAATAASQAARSAETATDAAANAVAAASGGSFWQIGVQGEITPTNNVYSLNMGYFTVDAQGNYVPDGNAADGFFELDANSDLMPKNS